MNTYNIIGSIMLLLLPWVIVFLVNDGESLKFKLKLLAMFYTIAFLFLGGIFLAFHK